MATFRRRASGIFLSLPAALFFLVAACVITLFHLEVAGVLVFVFFLSLLLVICDDVTVTTLPFLLVCTFVLKCYDSFDTFIVFAPLGVIPIGALLYHIFANKTKFSIGKSFWGIVAVSVAVTCGGLFSISPADYFSGTSLFYIAGLGIGMVAAYLLMKREFTPKRGYSLPDRLFAIFYLAGLFGTFMLLSHYLFEYDWEHTFDIQWSNNLSTLMMFFLPAPFYFSLTRNRLHLLMGLVFYATIVATGSRGGLLMGGIELLLLIIYVAIRDVVMRRAAIVVALIGAIVAVAYSREIAEFLFSAHAGDFISKDESRVQLLKRSIQDFFNNPVFGQGIGYTGNVDTYEPKKGAANWYHMMIPQIIGSLGSVGSLAYGYQFYTRFRLIFTKVTVPKIFLGLSYSGILLMSQVNPGEFCPIPYELLTVLLFIFLELPQKELDGTKEGAFTPLFSKNTAIF